MQYLLTEDEYSELDNRPLQGHLDEARAAIAQMRKMITRGKCIHDSKNEYCDMCPLSANGGHLAGESRPSWEMSKWMCPLNRSYSQ